LILERLAKGIIVLIIESLEVSFSDVSLIKVKPTLMFTIRSGDSSMEKRETADDCT
jgi:hypothetical protein